MTVVRLPMRSFLVILKYGNACWSTSLPPRFPLFVSRFSNAWRLLPKNRILSLEK